MSEANSEQRIRGNEALAATAAEMAAAGVRTLALYSRALPATVYGSGEFCAAVKQLVLTAGPHARVQVLIQEPDTAARGHPLVTLGHALSSFVEFRQPLAEHRDWRAECLIVDGRDLLERTTPDSLDALRYTSPAAAARAARRFDAAWEVADSLPSLRRLHIS